MAQGTPEGVVIEATYQGILRQGTEAFTARGKSMSTSKDTVATVMKVFQNSMVDKNVGERISRFRTQITELTRSRPKTGVLLEVLIHEHPPSGQKILTSVKVIGIGESDVDAAASSLTLDAISVKAPDGMIRSPSSYLIWYTYQDDGLVERTIPYPLDQTLWRKADQMARRGKIAEALAVDRVRRLELAAKTAKFAEAAQYIANSNADQNTKNQIATLERERIEAGRAWEAAMKKYEEAKQKAARDEGMASLMEALDGLAAGLSIAEALTSQPMTKIDGVVRPVQTQTGADLALWKQMEQASKQELPMVLLEAKGAADTLQKKHQDLKREYEEAPNFPADKIPSLPLIPQPL